jgi:hypothetical protein
MENIMRYIMIILFSLSLPAMALKSSLSKSPENAPNLLENIYKNTEKPCDPVKELHIPPFN